MNQKKNMLRSKNRRDTFHGDSPLASNGKIPFVEIPRKRIFLLDASRKWMKKIVLRISTIPGNLIAQFNGGRCAGRDCFKICFSFLSDLLLFFFSSM